ENRKRIDPAKYVTADLGLPTLTDILAELEKPGRDPRETFEVFEFASGVDAISDLTTGMILNGLVTNVTNFGAFVDVGVHQDGLVHISQLADKFVKHPSDVVQVRQQVKVKVMDVDLDRGRISLSMKDV
ncbi:MAG: S1 RNA-binding domain-containing protein, partial [Candidatus Latescibacteria bacterium]|nr:S1 RNA-binding domain-containing protein [Candidatus Latescibacterota bacterium]